MSSRKFKTISAIFLSIIYFMFSCFGSVSFAVTSDTAGENVESWQYYFENQGNSLYATVLDSFSVVLDSFTGFTQQRWELIYVSNGYYRIRNVSNGKYLTAPTDFTDGSYIEQSVLSSSLADRQLWSFTQVYLEEEYTFRIQAKSHEGSELYLASDSTLNVYGYDLIQGYDWEDDYTIWTLEPVKTAYLLGIDYGQSGHDHTSALEYADTYFEQYGHISNLIITESSTCANVKNYLENSSVFILRAHGYLDDIGTVMSLNEESTQEIKSWDIHHFSSGTGIDMSNCDVVAFVGCYTAAYPTQSLTDAAIGAGADVAIGFTNQIYCTDANNWTREFTTYYTMGCGAEESAYNARYAVGSSTSISSMVVETQGG